MPNLDLSKLGDFARATMQPAAGVLQAIDLAGRDPAQWQVLEAGYVAKKNVSDPTNVAAIQFILFHVFESKEVYSAGLGRVADSGGRRKVKYAFPYMDGQTSDDLGKRAETFQVEAIIHGNRYLQALQRLLKELNEPGPGILRHPIRGLVSVIVEDWNITHQNSDRKAATVSITFSEHNFTIGQINFKEDTTVKGALSKALEAISTIDRVISNVVGAATFVKSIRNQISQLLAEYKNQFQNDLVNINRTYNSSGTADIPGLVPANIGGATSDIFSVVNSAAQDSQISQSLETAAVALSTERIKKDVISTRQKLQESLDLLESGNGPFDFYHDIVDLKQTAIDLQDALEKGIASSRAQIVQYVTPRLMSLREVAFINGISVDEVDTLELLNPELESYNYIPAGTSVQVTVA